jgi:hypothetical protein
MAAARITDDPSYQSQTAYYNDGEFLNADED